MKIGCNSYKRRAFILTLQSSNYYNYYIFLIYNLTDPPRTWSVPSSLLFLLSKWKKLRHIPILTMKPLLPRSMPIVISLSIINGLQRLQSLLSLSSGFSDTYFAAASEPKTLTYIIHMDKLHQTTPLANSRVFLHFCARIILQSNQLCLLFSANNWPKISTNKNDCSEGLIDVLWRIPTHDFFFSLSLSKS